MGTAKKHGLSYTPEYRVWQTMRLRCTEPKNPAWKNYGGRGITVCAAWLNDSAAFIAHVGPKPSPRHEIDRIDNNLGYEPWNVRWVLRKTNARNRRSSRWVEFRGQRRLLAELVEEFSVPRDTLGWRLREGWDIDRAVTTPARTKASNGEGLGYVPRPRTTKSGEPNISWRASKQRWRVSVMVSGKKHELGCYRTLDEARVVRDREVPRLRANLAEVAGAAQAG